MKLPMSWLREWVDVTTGPEPIANALTMRGLYVESIEMHGHSYPGVVVARILEVQQHPNADKLSVCRVDSGAGELRVVCGAPNVHAGMIAPLATVGAKLPGGVEIRKSKIRGEESQGMLCSARELELSGDDEGIVDLKRLLGEGADLTLGRPLQDALGPPDAVLEVEIPFNRGDCLSVLGLAAEVKAAFAGSWTQVAARRLEAKWSPGRSRVPVVLEDPEGCPFYLAQVIEGVAVAPSPPWLVQRLEAVGQRAINNVVDATNLVLFELGQPLHAFDLATLHGPEIRVRRARPNERITTLDGKARALDPEVLMICDRDRAVAIAGVMGGAETEVSEGTTSLLLECAWFEPRVIRRGAKSLGLASEASKRFERGVDLGRCEQAVLRFLELMAQLCPDSRPGAAGIQRESRRAGAAAASEPLLLRASRVARLVGVPIEIETIERHLDSLGFVSRRTRDREVLEVSVPSNRFDVALEDDLVEEVARAYGYDRIPEAAPDSRGLVPERGARERVVEQARRAMLARGLTEAWTSSLISEREAIAVATLLGESDPRLVRLANPMSREGEVLRPNPIAGLLRACTHNLRQGLAAVRLFEVGTGFRGAATTDGSTRLPEETLFLAAIVTGPRLAHGHDAAQGPLDFFDAKGLWEAWLEEMRVDSPEWRSYASGGWKPGASAEVAAMASRIGWAGTLGQQLLRGWDIEVPVHAFVALLDPLIRGTVAGSRAALPGRFPPVRRDLAYFVPERVTHRELEATLRQAAGELLLAIELFDVYAGPGTPPGMKSLAYALQFQHAERTLAESEVQVVQDRMTEAVANQCGGRLRER
ncbi:MAG TPA: phenylalanine--tRNA ligase subunit beta [Candidatus Limnocylindria bacterium]|nr:phenylalanine--tRNA ligase subunit beta [Candidatus Limnocylindria bacterium]